ncbi:DHH family phosphoesterase [[Mycoplasma] gypis]|uniref:DHH family phosphoesterase n=1 Tax=[Mycoplasma] gypis TaxID=92404 RepID=A0ABZ2RM81_9BACT|nr:DHH family phosphoesterase [[Mycoplasma] gypis]MBN0919217.1 DHH family phosphoesterase [[Mycoplasma] gypis]
MLNEKFQKFWDYIQKAQKITLCTHVEPDGDTIGSAFALKELILLNTNNKQVLVSGMDYPRNLLFLLDQDQQLVGDDFFNNSLKVVVDTSTKLRIYDQRVITKDSLKIDHHPEENEWLFEIGGDHWPATGQLITLMVQALGLKTNQKILQALASAIITDTEFFQERNISAQTFDCFSFLLSQGLDYSLLLKNIALTNEENTFIFNACKKRKTKGIVTYIISKNIVTNDIARPLVAAFTRLVNTEVSLAILKRSQGDYRCEIRSKNSFDVSRVAFHFGGGGHKNSSGFIIKKLNELPKILDFINKKY